jgi:hypothetical protein
MYNCVSYSSDIPKFNENLSIVSKVIYNENDNS